MESVVHWIIDFGYVGIFLLLMLGIVGLPIPDESLLAFSGVLVFQGQLHFFPTLFSAFLGSTSGITISYLLGKTGGNFLLRKVGHYIHFTEEKINNVRWWFQRTGKWGLVISYFIPGVRHFSAFAAGSSKLQYSLFAGFAYIGAAIWVASFISLGY